MRMHFRASGVMGIAMVAAGLASPVRAALFTYDFPGSPTGLGAVASQTATPPTGVAFSDFTRTNVVNDDSANVFNSRNWNTTATIDLTEFVTFSLTAQPLYTVTITDIAFTVDGSNTVADEFQVGLSTNGFSTFSPRGADVVPVASANKTWNFTDVVLTPGQTLAFRFYVYGDTQADGSGVPSTSGTFSLDNVVISGTAVPEPASLALLAMSGLIGLRRRRAP